MSENESGPVQRLMSAIAVGMLLVVGGSVASADAGGSDRPVAAEVPVGSAGVGSSSWGCGDWGMYGNNAERTFSHTCPTAISPTTAATLIPAWYFRTGATFTASPAVVDGVVYVGDWTGTMYAIETLDGTEVWSAVTEPAPGAPFGPIVSSAAVADVVMPGGVVQRLVVFGAGPRMYALDAATGEEVWVHYFGAGVELEQTEFESSPVIHDGVIYVGMDVHNRRMEDTGGKRGGVFALDAATGELRWYFNPEWDDERSGCSSVWSSPTLNLEAGLVYAATGNCPQDEPEWTETIEATFALDMQTGELVWSFQPHEPNRNDFDFGATPNLFTDAAGRRVLGIGNKDGLYYALDPLTGDLFWSTKVHDPLAPQEDFAVGGFIGSTAIWEGNVYGGVAIGTPPYFHSLDGETGELRWSSVAGPMYAASAAAGGVVFAASLDDSVKAYDPATGAPVWIGPLSGPSSSGAVIVGNSLYVGAGTSSSDLCGKDTPVFSDVCFEVFNGLLGSLGGVHAFRLPQGDPPRDDATGDDSASDGSTDVEPAGEQLPATGAGWVPLSAAALAATLVLGRRRGAGDLTHSSCL